MHRSWTRAPGRIGVRQTGRISARHKLALLVAAAWAGSAAALPTDGTIRGGQGAISTPDAHSMVVQQASPLLAIDWQSFGIAAGEKVQFQQPGAASIALNRVLGSNASEIFGRLSANGQVFLVNPNGVLFAPGAQVNVGGLVASTLDLSPQDFMQGRTRFSGDSAAAVVNQGSITASPGGYAALLGAQVRNDGSLRATLGSVVLGAGQAFSLNFNGNSLVSLVVERGAVNALAHNGGLIAADGGQALLTAKAADTLLGAVVNNDGVIEANSVANVNGVIRLQAGEGGSATAGGTLSARGAAVGQSGGRIEVSGDTVIVSGGAQLDASGEAGGGAIRVGGGLHGADAAVYNAQNTTIESGAQLRANALAAGNGGSVVVWSDNVTGFYGSIQARGGAAGGRGGMVETSGKVALDIHGAQVDAGAPAGAPGTWLLDPRNVTLTNATAGGTFAANTFTPTADDATVDVTVITGALAGANVQVTTGSTGTQAGDITVASNVAWSSGHSLTLNAAGSINLNADINAPAGSLVATAGTAINLNHSIEPGGGATFNATLNVLGNYTIDSSAGGGILQFGGTIQGPGALTLNAGGSSGTSGTGQVQFTANIGDSTQLGGLSVTSATMTPFPSSTQISGNLAVDTGSNISSIGGIFVTGTTSLTTAGGINLNSSNDFQGTVTVHAAPSGVSIFDSNTLTMAPFSAGSANLSATNVQLSGSYATTGGFQVSGETDITGATSIDTSATGGAITFASTIQGPGALTLNAGGSSGTLSTGQVQFFGNIGNVTPLGGLFITSTNMSSFPSITQIGGNLAVDTGSNINSIGGIFVTGTTSLTTAGGINLNSSNDFQGTVTVHAVPFGVSIFDANTLTMAPFSAGSAQLSATNVQLSGSYATTSGGFQVSGETDITSATSIDSSAAGGAITFGGTVQGPGTLTLNAGGSSGASGTGQVQFFGNIGNVTPLGGLSITSATMSSFPSITQIGGNLAVDTGSNINSIGGISVTGTTSLTTAGGINLNSFNDFQGTVTVHAAPSGVSMFDANTLTMAPFSAGSAQLSGTNVQLSGSYATTLGGFQVSGEADITGATSIQTAFTGGTITFTGSVQGPGTLALDTGSGSGTAGTGQVQLFGSIGDLTALGGLSITTATLNTFPVSTHVAGNLAVDAASAFAQNGPITVGGSATFTMPGATFSKTVSTASLQFNALANDITLNAGSALSASGAGNALVLAMTGNFVNNVGAGVLSAPAGRWLVYSTSPAASTEGGLTAAAGTAEPRLYHRTFGGNAPASIAEPGNHLIYSTQPTLNIAAGNAGRAYGSANPAFNYTVNSGFVTDDGVTDNAAAAGLAGTLATAAVPGSSVAGGPYAITQGTLAADAGYGIAFTNGSLTLTPAPLTISADNKTRSTGAANPAFTASYAGFVLGDSAASLGGTLAFATPAISASPAGPYAITPSGSTSSNYAITFVGGTLTVSNAPPPPAVPVFSFNDELEGAIDDAGSYPRKPRVPGAVQNGASETGRGSGSYRIVETGIKLPEGLR